MGGFFLTETGKDSDKDEVAYLLQKWTRTVRKMSDLSFTQINNNSDKDEETYPLQRWTRPVIKMSDLSFIKINKNSDKMTGSSVTEMDMNSDKDKWLISQTWTATEIKARDLPITEIDRNNNEDDWLVSHGNRRKQR